MFTNKPYLLRAFNEWIVDNSCTPYIVVDATQEGVKVPTQYVENGEIILDISPSAVRDLVIANDRLSFKAMFGSVVHVVATPMRAISAIYAQENGQGMVFSEMEEMGDEWDTQGEAGTGTGTAQVAPLATNKKSKAHLKLVE